MATMGSTNIPFETIYGEKLNIIGSFLEFGCISYVTKWDKLNKQMTYKMYKNHGRVCRKLYKRHIQVVQY